ncbi:hypothetical protein V8G54_022105, partial [Vigna mungo]
AETPSWTYLRPYSTSFGNFHSTTNNSTSGNFEYSNGHLNRSPNPNGSRSMARTITDDTSWEEWTQLSSDYHLGDKVIFPEADLVSNQTTGQLNNARPKRITTTPVHLKDYVP